MPYGLIIAIMAATLLVSGAPLTGSGLAPPWSLASWWVVKTILWAIFCRIVLFRAKARAMAALRPASLPVATLEYLALLPLCFDAYLIGFRHPFVLFFGKAWGGFLSEVAGLGLYLFYMAIAWVEAAKLTAPSHPWRSAVEEARMRLRVLAPILVAYVFLTFLSQSGRLLGWEELDAFLSTGKGQAVLLASTLAFFLVVMPGLVVRMWGCKDLTDPYLADRLKGVLRELSVGFRRMVLWDTGPTGPCTAAVLGVLAPFRYLLLTPCIVSVLSPKELEAVVAHEAGHVRHRHLLWYALFVIGFSLVVYRWAGELVNWLFARPEALDLLVLMERWPQSFLALVAIMPLAVMMVLYFRFLIGYFMRNFERQADLEAFRLQGHPWHLIMALRKVAVVSGIDPERPNWHHFSIAERIRFLQRCAEEPAAAKAHEGKVRRSLMAFMAVIALLYTVPSLLPSESWRKQAQVNLVETYFEQMLQHGEARPEWFMFMGQFFHEKGRYAKAEAAYLQVLTMDPDNAEAMNNLAWLYLKATDPAFHRPCEALILASRAAAMKPVAPILDTYAEALFTNGFIERAIALEMEALKRATGDRSFYQAQLARFKKALAERRDGPESKEPLSQR